jgi:predicted nucleic acid-binding protein
VPYLLDTNVLLRWADPRHPLNPTIQEAVETLKAAGEDVYVTPQNIVEFWNVWTRPANRNGFGYTPTEAALEAARILAFFRFASDTTTIFSEWLGLVEALDVSGVKVHDTRLVAVMRVHGLTHLLTFNGDDFRRFPSIIVVDPRSVGGISAP